MTASVATLAQKLPRDSSLRPADTAAFRTLCWATVVLAGGLLCLGLIVEGRTVADRLPELGLWSLLVALAVFSSLRLWRNVHFGLDFPLLLALSFIYGPVASGTVAFVASIDPRELRGEMTLHRALFNRSQIALAVMTAGTVFRLM